MVNTDVNKGRITSSVPDTQASATEVPFSRFSSMFSMMIMALSMIWALRTGIEQPILSQPEGHLEVSVIPLGQQLPGLYGSPVLDKDLGEPTARAEVEFGLGRGMKDTGFGCTERVRVEIGIIG